MKFTKLLKYGMTDITVSYMKELLYELKYLKTLGNKNEFDSAMKTAVKNFQKKNFDSNGKKLTVEGIIGEKTWDSIEKKAGRVYTELLKYGSKGNDVLELKKQVRLHNVKIKIDIFSYFSTK